MLANYHSHSNYCDGSMPLEDYVLEAINLGFDAYGFSSHAPLPFACQWAMPVSQIQDYLRRINFLKEKWQHEILLLKSLEIDYIPGVTGPRNELFTELDLDYTIGSIHFLDTFKNGIPWAVDDSHRKFVLGLENIYEGDIVKVVKQYYENTRKMALEETPTIIGHLDKIKMHNTYTKHFNEHDAWYKDEVFLTLECIKKSGAFIEVNTRGIYKGKSESLYPSPWILEEVLKHAIPIVLNSDAHMPHEINLEFDFALETLQGIGFKHLKNFNGKEWIDSKIEKSSRSEESIKITREKLSH